MQLAIVHPKVLARSDFNPTASHEGIPGAEETLLNLVKEFSRQGLSVTVYTQTATTSRHGESLFWKPITEIRPDDWFDCLCLWTDNPNNLGSLANHLPCSASSCVRLVNQSNNDALRHVLDDGKRVGLTQTDWFVQQSPYLGNYPLFRWNNGVHPHRYAHASSDSKIRGKIFWGSDYDRGLIHILSNWKRIKNRHPHVQLTVCYGWDVFDAKISSLPQEQRSQMISFRDQINQLLKQEDIRHLGRVSHRQVDEELLSSEFWFYPCTFPENCSTLSLKAQAAKCVPVIIPTGGLSETVRYGVITSHSLWQLGRVNEQLAASAVDEWLTLADMALANGYQAYRSIIEANLRRIKIHYSYPALAHQFISRFF